MVYIIIAVAGLLILVALLTFLEKRKRIDTPPVVVPDAECCGAHAVCEKGLKKADPSIVYFDDEELDRFKGVAADSYTDEEIDLFRDVLYSIRHEELEDWFISLDKREINFPDKLKSEALAML